MEMFRIVRRYRVGLLAAIALLVPAVVLAVGPSLHVGAQSDEEERVVRSEPALEQPAAVPGNAVLFAEPGDETFGPTRLPAAATVGLPPDWAHRARKLAVQGMAGLGAAVVIMAGTWWASDRRARG